MHTQASASESSMPIDASLACNHLTERAERSAHAAANINALGEMARGITHDFRNILCMLSSGLSIADANAGNPAKLRLALAAIEDGIARGLKITNRLLAFAAQHEARPSAEDINALLAALKGFLSYGAGPGIRIVLELGRGLPECLVDAPQFNAAILNLVVNARDAMPADGTIRISTKLIHRGLGENARDYVRVRVRDDGAGMAPDVLARIFDPFFTTKGDNGSGLGIPQVQALMRALGGDVRVHSIVGKGTAFDLFFPAGGDPPGDAPDAWRQLDRWADEGGAIGPGPRMRS